MTYLSETKESATIRTAAADDETLRAALSAQWAAKTANPFSPNYNAALVVANRNLAEASRFYDSKYGAGASRGFEARFTGL